jgi:hypothetical protein
MWQFSGLNDINSYCGFSNPYSQNCITNCQKCPKRSCSIDIHELLYRSGYAYGALAQLLSHVFKTGKKVFICLLVNQLNSDT